MGDEFAVAEEVARRLIIEENHISETGFGRSGVVEAKIKKLPVFFFRVVVCISIILLLAALRKGRIFLGPGGVRIITVVIIIRPALFFFVFIFLLFELGAIGTDVSFDSAFMTSSVFVP